MKRIPYYLVFGSFIPYLLIFTLPFLPVSGGLKAGLIALFVILGEGMFWIGGIFVGKDVMTNYRQKMNPAKWFKNKNKQG
ncbi:transporter suffix domain-containing protein [Gottfriedia luciferensis]|uniref:transporter suffix domain-containing protein n=1 Tax=Gottfriedia luciferensis TaxID=178774 RepID=UPI000B44C794|nr:transporter suffix domain-containing protein [Gottfriedia luciferensis]